MTSRAVYGAAVRARLPVANTGAAAGAVECVRGRTTVAEIQENLSPFNSRAACYR